MIYTKLKTYRVLSPTISSKILIKINNKLANFCHGLRFLGENLKKNG